MDARERHLATDEAKATVRHGGDSVLRHLVAEAHAARRHDPSLPTGVAGPVDTGEPSDLDPTTTAPVGEHARGVGRPRDVTDDGPRRAARRGAVRAALVILESVLAVGAVVGGVGLIGGGAGIPDSWLGPFSSWVLPGVLLLALVAVPMSVAAAGETLSTRWARDASLAAGVVQTGWIASQWALLQKWFVLQPIVLAIALAIVTLAWWGRDRATWLRRLGRLRAGRSAR